MMDDLLQEMIDPAPARPDTPRRRRLWSTVAIVGLAAVGATTLTTSAIFTDNDSAAASIATGTVDLAIGQDVPFTFEPQNLAPGQSTYMPLQVKSNGSLALRYTVSYRASVATNDTPDPVLDPAPTAGDLRNVLRLSVYPLAREQCTADTFPAGPPPALNTPVSPWPDALSSLVGARPLTMDVPTEWLCFKVDLPNTAGNEYQDTAVTLDLTFNAEQTTANP